MKTIKAKGGGFMSSGIIKVLGIVTTVAGAGLTILQAFIDDKKMDEKIDERLEAREKARSEEKSE